jgi:hypothetical protein
MSTIDLVSNRAGTVVPPIVTVRPFRKFVPVILRDVLPLVDPMDGTIAVTVGVMIDAGEDGAFEEDGAFGDVAPLQLASPGLRIRRATAVRVLFVMVPFLD